MAPPRVISRPICYIIFASMNHHAHAVAAEHLYISIYEPPPSSAFGVTGTATTVDDGSSKGPG
jgi:hypothetical protein